MPEVNNSKHGLFYQVHGHASELSDLVLIHGLFGNSDNLSVIRRHFEGQRRVISIDLPDHGKSIRTESFNFDDYSARVTQLIESEVSESCVLVGHSLGGKVAMLVAKRLAERVQQLVVMDIAPVPYPARHQNVFKGLSAIELETLKSRSDAKTILNETLEDTGTQAFLLKSLYQDEDEHWQWRFNLPLILSDYEKLSAWPYSGICFAGPTLFIKGAESDYIQASQQATINEQFPQAKAKIVQAGHWLHAQKPQVVNALIEKFIT